MQKRGGKGIDVVVAGTTGLHTSRPSGGEVLKYESCGRVAW